jgi:uncharacterized Rmd1/YagE family protein
MTEFINDRIESMVVGRQFSQAKIQSFLFDNFTSVRYRDTFHIQFKQGECWLFDYGVLVFWGVFEDVVSSNKSRIIVR